MIKTVVIIIGVVLSMSSQVNAEEKGIIGRVYEDDMPVIYKFVNELPESEVRNQLAWLTVLSWKYDGATNNGMPLEAENQRMIVLEDTIEDGIESDSILRHVYSRTGNNLKEFVYYIHDQEEFLASFNKAVDGHPQYPIEINFYEDGEWEDFKKLLNDFKPKG
jgi:hypothetical protein